LWDTVTRLAPPFAAITSVVVVILLLIVLNGRPLRSGPAPGAVVEPMRHPSPPTAVIPSAVPTGTSTDLTVPPVMEPPVTQTPVTQTPATQTPAAGHPPVTVLNNSRRTGLAAHVAGEVRAHGWPVRSVGNFRGRIAASTLYYADGQRAAAEELARTMPAIRRVEPRFAGLPGVGLTLVVTRDWTT
jgi:hypothetical protein